MTHSTQSNAVSLNNTVDKGNEHFPFISTGFAYIKDLDEKQNKKTGEYFTTCQLAVLIGPKDAEKRQYQFVNVVVIGSSTQDLIWECEQDLAAKKSVLIEFKISNIRPNAFQRNDGTLGASLNAHLFGIEKIWVNQELTYSVEPKTEAPAAIVSNESTASVPPQSKRGSKANTRAQPQPQAKQSGSRRHKAA